MQRLLLLCVCLVIILLAGCDVPKPPPELPTPTPGSGNPESDASRFNLTPVRPTPEPTFRPLDAPPGVIYFVRDSGLWRVAPDGSGEKQLSNLPITSPPQPSPDGSAVAWLSGRALYVIPAGGGEPRKLFSGDLASSQRLGWTPDSSTLGFITSVPSTMGVEQAWALAVAGGDPLLITTMEEGVVSRGPTYERMVKWSPDGLWVLVSGVNNPMRLLRWPLSLDREDDPSTSSRRAGHDITGGEPDWSPDSRTILYTESLRGALRVYDVLAGESEPFLNEQQFVGTGLGEYAQGPCPQWSPASTGAISDPLAYRSRSKEGEPRVSIRLRSGEELPPLPGNTNNPAWSPSGDKLVVEIGALQEDTLGLKWAATGLSIAQISFDGEHKMMPLVKDGRWPVWGK